MKTLIPSTMSMWKVKWIENPLAESRELFVGQYLISCGSLPLSLLLAFPSSISGLAKIPKADFGFWSEAKWCSATAVYCHSLKDSRSGCTMYIKQVGTSSQGKNAAAYFCLNYDLFYSLFQHSRHALLKLVDFWRTIKLAKLRRCVSQVKEALL